MWKNQLFLKWLVSNITFHLLTLCISHFNGKENDSVQWFHKFIMIKSILPYTFNNLNVIYT